MRHCSVHGSLIHLFCCTREGYNIEQLHRLCTIYELNKRNSPASATGYKLPIKIVFFFLWFFRWVYNSFFFHSVVFSVLFVHSLAQWWNQSFVKWLVYCLQCILMLFGKLLTPSDNKIYTHTYNVAYYCGGSAATVTAVIAKIRMNAHKYH